MERPISNQDIEFRSHGDEKKKSAEICKSLKPTVQATTEALAFFEEQLEAAGASMKTVNQINVVVDEIFSNIVRYSGASTAELAFEKRDHTMMIRFTDDGKPYDPTKKEDPDVTLSVEDRQIGGLGIFIVKKIMDTVNYQYKDGKNILVMTKNLE